MFGKPEALIPPLLRVTRNINRSSNSIPRSFTGPHAYKIQY
jgi:hypothetical protein